MISRKLIFFSLLLFAGASKAQVKDVAREIKRIEFNLKKVEERRWKRTGNLQINFGQHHYENWVGGNIGKLEIFGKLSQRLKYQNPKLVWESSLDVLYGVNKNYGQGIRKSSDQIIFNSILGKKVSEHFSYSYFLNMQTQLTNSYNYGKEDSDFYRASGFLAPLYINSGPGIMWRKSDNFVLNLAPASLKATYVNGKVYEYRKSIEDFISNYHYNLFGVEAGKKINLRLGLYASMYLKYTLLKNVEVENRLSLYSDYLDEPANIDMDYRMNVNFKINKLLTTNLMVQAMYDDDVYSGFQLREHFGVGFKFDL
ncbi:DUF3078 domain-containing protein [Ornithobacterium rhinotracheale]|uniref:DUF3078 domain-containing protein n=1 Tax=Ornithobacterium rhinotracheale TaxID=28251 RepID=UPI00129C50BB|nr:DUF3078 domain-containing protein [Ornithobacterium rhinotracheale]MRI63209.1 DUF3078 domain-containing protein [Ornithobacterium rhinotracheale]MRJ10045.1 DUF3078 domain-containing protein [Ornithobacterium rhinotracheale]